MKVPQSGSGFNELKSKFCPVFVPQNEKCHLLIEHETQKLKELDEEHSVELKEWREKLRPRKKVLVLS